MTPLLRFLERWLPPAGVRVMLAVFYAAMIFAIVMLAGYGHIAPVIYLDVH